MDFVLRIRSRSHFSIRLVALAAEDEVHTIKVFRDFIIAAVWVGLEAFLEAHVIVEGPARLTDTGDFKPIEIIACALGLALHGGAALIKSR